MIHFTVLLDQVLFYGVEGPPLRAFLISFFIFIYIKKIVFVNVFPIYVPYEKQPYQKQK